MDAMALARDERADLADLLATLSEEQWVAPTLCAGWTVRDVVAHVVSYEELDRWGLVRRFADGRFAPNRVNAVGVRAYLGHDPEDLLALLRRSLTPRGLTAGFGGRVALVDGLIHHQDIRRPLGLPREIPPERLRATLAFARVAPPIRAFTRVRGLRVAATDLGWSSGRGPAVEGPGEPLLMAMAGRGDALGELTGPGRDTLAARVAG